MNIIAVVPARSGSKRVPRKNIRELNGRPLISYTLKVARDAGCFSRILVSTDDLEISEIARCYGGEAPWLRSEKNSGDKSNVLDAVLEVLSCIESSGEELPDAVMLLQPTSPFRRVETVLEAVGVFEEGGGESVVSVSPAIPHPWWCKSVDSEGNIRPFIEGVEGSMRSQDLPPAYVPNGVLYVSSVSNLLEMKSFYSRNTRAIIVESRREALDIDDEFDWMVAEAICAECR